MPIHLSTCRRWKLRLRVRSPLSKFGSAPISGETGLHEEEKRRTLEGGLHVLKPFVEMGFCPTNVPKDSPERSRRPSPGQCPDQEAFVADASRGPMLAKLTGASTFFQLTCLLLIPSRRELARMPVVPYASWYLHIEHNSTWCNELRFLLPINRGIAFLSLRSAHLA